MTTYEYDDAETMSQVTLSGAVHEVFFSRTGAIGLITLPMAVAAVLFFSGVEAVAALAFGIPAGMSAALLWMARVAMYTRANARGRWTPP